MNVLNQRIRLALIIFLILMMCLAYSVVQIWFSSFSDNIDKMYPLEKSQNKEASKEFVMAMKYRLYISKLHNYFDYDHFIMKQILNKVDKHFNKGKSLLPDDSIEDIVWWGLFYQEIYGAVYDKKGDESMDFKAMSDRGLDALIDNIGKMIKRLPYGNNYFKIQEIDENTFFAMTKLIAFYKETLMERYKRKCNSKCDGAKQYYLDAANSKLNEGLYIYLNETYNKHFKESRAKNLASFEYNAVALDILIFDLISYRLQYQDNNDYLPKEFCTKDNTTNISKHLGDLMNIQKNSKYYDENIMDSKRAIFFILEYNCKNLNPKLKNILKDMINFKSERNKK